MRHNYKIYVPSTIDVDNSIDNSAKVNETLSFLSSLFGGATATDASGAWMSETSGLVTEKVTICYAFASFRNFWKYRKAVKEYAAKLRDDMRQEAISLEIDGRLQFV